MDKQQRAYLISEIEKSHKNETARLKNMIPKRPSLNNYIVSALLEGKLKYKTNEELHIALTDMAKNMEDRKQIVETKSDYNYAKKDYDEISYVKLPPELLFEIPESYKEALAKQRAIKFEIEFKINELESNLSSAKLRITLGSNAVLDNMIREIDSLGEMSLVGDKLLLGDDYEKANFELGAADEQKLLG